MKILITGGTGFIGSTLVPLLVEKGFKVTLLVRKKNIPDSLKGLDVELCEGSLENLESLKNAVRGMDSVIHLAGIVSAFNVDKFYAINAQGTYNLAHAISCENRELKQFVHVSSLAAGGPMSIRQERTEEMEDQPVSHYGKSKLKGEKELLRFKGNFPMVILRPPIVYGAGDKGVFIIIKSAQSKITPLLMPKKGISEKSYSFIYVKDLCQGIITLLNQKQYKKGEVFYISDGSIYKFSEILDTISEITQKKGIRVKLPFFVLSSVATLCEWYTRATGNPLPLNKDKLNELKPDYWICSNFKISSLGFQSQYKLKDGMKETIQWYKNNKLLP